MATRFREDLPPWDSQPQELAGVNPAYPFAFALTASGKGFVDHAIPEYFPSTSGTTPQIGPGGQMVKGGSLAGSDGVSLANRPIARFENSAGTLIIAMQAVTLTGTPAFFSVRNNSTTTISFLPDNVAGTRRLTLGLPSADLFGPDNSYLVGEDDIIACSWGPAGMRIFSRSAGLVASNALTAVPGSTSIDPWLLNRSTGGRGVSGNLYAAFGILEQLPDSVVLELLSGLPALYGGLLTPQSIWVPVSAGGGPTPITATLAQTLANATSSATGTVALSGATAATLDNATLASAAKLALTGTTTATLADATLSATGTLAVTTSGVVAQTLADATVTATAALPIKGATTQTLANATASATGTLPIKGATTATLAGATLDAQGTAQAVTVGTLSATLADATVAATAKLAIGAVASPTLADAILAATVTMPLAGLSGIVTQTLQDATSAATGTVLIKGSATVTLDACTLVAAGAEGVIVPVVLGSLVGSTRKTASGRPAAVSSYARSNRQTLRR